MTVPVRKFLLTAHIIFSVGWLGAVVAYVALAIIGLTNQDIKMIKVVYPALELVGWYVIVPICLAALLTGLIQSLGTNWGLFRHYWITVKFLLTSLASIVLVNHMPVVSKMANIVTDEKLSTPDFEMLRIQLLIHAAGGLLILIFTTVLSVYKPWGLTPYGLRKQQETDKPTINSESAKGKKWGKYVLLGIIILFLLFIIRHLAGGGMGSH